jgi:type IX secretion system PorP/SprF family membrane protein
VKIISGGNSVQDYHLDIIKHLIREIVRNECKASIMTIHTGHFSLYIFIFCSFFCNGQDTQLSQFYAAPLYLNPAFTGTIKNSRAVFNFRNQWSGVGNPYVTAAASFDHYFAKFKSGLGVMVMQNKAGTPSMRSTDISLLYSYRVALNETWTFIPGLQATYSSRNLDFYKLTFPDQYSNTGFTGASTNEPLNYSKKSFMDFSAGGLLYSSIFWIGTSYSHLNHPNQSFSSNTNRLPGKINLHAGARIPIASSPRGRSTQKIYREKAIIPAVIYQSQAKFDQLDLGLYMLYEPLIIGLWYRGLPIKHYALGYNNNESIIGLVGLQYKGFTFGYSYDFVISALTMQSRGAHEISITYIFGKERFIHSKMKYRPLPCPNFYRHREEELLN